ncbi:DUF1273 domain-containing protein [Liquorilactobacillus mali]|uniref:DUF1273 domain-containing protein n=1 Tax=Liquorilactobacillus mali TaxID=1618 RepID=UPI00234FD541|nr:DUF1273 domain-containing protein [Liquorilactobacillus mali]MDC7952009.1 DUF1273 domain-containing protein [Liquorilactobacillus mali]
MRMWVTGYRSYELNIYKDSDPKVEVLKSILKDAIRQKAEDGLEWVLVGGQSGIEQMTAEVVCSMKKEFPELKVAMMLPYSDFESRWKEERKATFALLKSQVDFCATVSSKEYKSPQQLRNWQKFMLEHTEEALLVYDSEFEGKTKYDVLAAKKYAETHEYNVVTIDMDWLENGAREFFERKNENDLQ